MQTSVAHLSATGRFHGRVVALQDSYMVVEEFTLDNRNTMVLPVFVANVRRYTELDCRNIFRQIASCVQMFHAVGLSHRNLHPANFVVETGVSKLGMARYITCGFLLSPSPF
jgi:serine/threonine protein kinase